jgi:hypothetical protein
VILDTPALLSAALLVFTVTAEAADTLKDVFKDGFFVGANEPA